MSEFHIISTSAPVPPTVPTSFVTDSGTAIPQTNILNILSTDSIANNDNGTSTIGSGNTVTILLTNRQTGTTNTGNANPATILTFALGATPGVYYVEGDVIAFNTTDTAGAGYAFSSAVRTTGAAGTEIGTEFKDLFEEAAMATADIDISVSANDLLVTVTGIVGKSIDWNCLLTYRFVS